MEIKFSMPDPNHKTNVTVRAQTTMSAPTLSKILQKSGIDSDAQEVSQPPLDTAVIDSLNEPKADPSGNDPLTQLDQIASTQQAQDAHDVAQATVAQKMGLAEVQDERAQAKHELELEGIRQQQEQAAAMNAAAIAAKRTQGKA
jgi:hypothetical protein